jgi:enoyl reductase-like protein
MGENVKRLALIDTERYNAMMKSLDQLVSDKKILDNAKQTAAEGELIEGHANMMSSVARKPSHATDDIINYNKKKNNYRNELKERAATPVVDAAAAVAGAAPRAGSLKSSETLIRTFLKRKGVAEVDKGVKFGHKTLSFAYDDMISDLTKNVKKTNTNLSSQQHAKLLKELKRTGMPVGYIRSENLRKQYRDLDNGVPQIPQTPPPAYQTPPALYQQQQQPSTSFSFAPPLRKKGKLRPHMFDDKR